MELVLSRKNIQHLVSHCEEFNDEAIRSALAYHDALHQIASLRPARLA
jgi:hypothetical protein